MAQANPIIGSYWLPDQYCHSEEEIHQALAHWGDQQPAYLIKRHLLK
jgi:hypothetical protein